MPARHAADRGDGAGGADGWDPPSPAALGDPDVTEGEVEADRIQRIDLDEGAGDFLGRFPVRRPPPAQANEEADPAHVDVEGYHEVRGVHALPHTEVDAVVGPH